MPSLEALERHIPGVKQWLPKNLSSPRARQKATWDEKEVDVLVCFGVSLDLYREARSWLHAHSAHRLVFVEESGEALAHLVEEEEALLLLNDRRVKLFFLESLLQMEPLAKKIAWSAVFLRVEVVGEVESPHTPLFREALQKAHLAAQLLLSDVADFGVSAIQTAKKNFARPFAAALDLQGAFSKIPALICGAGPSLEKNGALLDALRGRALLLAGGSAIGCVQRHVPRGPHFAAVIDRELEAAVTSAPLCFQARANPSYLARQPGKQLLAPDSHFSFINWIARQQTPFDGGWTVSTFLVSLALLWGCDPIIWVGVDLCYPGGKKYATSAAVCEEGLVQVEDREGQCVWTQRDWVQAARWLEETATAHPERTFINATEGGVRLKGPVEERRLVDIALPECAKLEEQVRTAVERLQIRAPRRCRWREWRASLLACQKKLSAFQRDAIEGEIAYEQLLLPLWTLWRPLFERELALDPYQIAFEEKLELNQILFFQQILSEHLNAL